MKKIISVFALITLFAAVAFAQQPRQRGEGEGWREKVRAEKVAFLTQELSLTETEAQAFWPVYNDVQARNREVFKAQWTAYKKLSEAVEAGDAAVEKLLDEYLAAKARCEQADADALPRYKKVLPVEKVARLMLAEEKFRHQQIGRLGGGHQGGPQGRQQGQVSGEHSRRQGNR